MQTHALPLRQGWSAPSGEAGEERAHRPGLALLSRAAMHEFYAARASDAATLSGCALAIGHVLSQGRPCLWVRQEAFDWEAGQPHAPGLCELGLDPARLIILRVKDATAALQAGLEGARCAGLGAVFLELWGEAPAYDLTASRRLALAARASGVPVFLTRIAAKVRPSAAETRWELRALPSRALAAQAPGSPAFELTLLRARNGREGQHDHLEWDRDARQFLSRTASENHLAEPARSPLSGSVVSVSFDRPRPPEPEPFPRREAS
jgi:protein ImuA